MINKFEAMLGYDLLLPFFDYRVRKLDHFARIGAHHMIVVLAVVEFEYGAAALKVMPRNETRAFELGKYAVDRRQSNVLTRVAKQLIHVFSAEVPRLVILVLQDLQNLYPRQRDFKAGVAQMVIAMRHGEVLL